MIGFLKKNWIVLFCFCIWIVTTTLQVKKPNSYQGFIGNAILAAGIIITFIRNKKNNIKSPLYSSNKKQHILNWVILIAAIILTTIITGYILIF